MRNANEVADESSWQWLRAGYLGKSTEGCCCFPGADFAMKVFSGHD